MKPWNEIDWKNVRYRIRKLQKRLALAAQEGDWKKIRNLQNLMYASYDARLLAVHLVTSRKNRRTPGIDGIFWFTDEERYKAAERINPKTHQFKPFKRIYVPKDHDRTKLRPLSIPTIEDRAVQALILLALDPVVETMADPHAYGYRKHRGPQNAVEDIMTSFGCDAGNIWILKTDIRECFENISHEWLLAHPPIKRKILERSLKCGYICRGRRYPTGKGLARGGIISPALTTFALSGFEPLIKEKYGTHVRFVRYVDDFLFSADDRTVLEEVKQMLELFLAGRGMTLSEEKTEIRKITEGVDFIGWNIRRTDRGITAKPSDKFVEELKTRLNAIFVQGTNWSRDRIIRKLNDEIAGWGLYHAYGITPDTYLELDKLVQNHLWQWAVKRHPKHTWKWIYFHYWRFRGTSAERRFSTETQTVRRFADTELRIPAKRDAAINPYLDPGYFRNRELRYVKPHNKRQWTRNW